MLKVNLWSTATMGEIVVAEDPGQPPGAGADRGNALEAASTGRNLPNWLRVNPAKTGHTVILRFGAVTCDLVRWLESLDIMHLLTYTFHWANPERYRNNRSG